jgi:probable phosphoglycerate mutase
LTEFGRKQAEQAAAALSNLPIHAIYCSPLQRARQTAEAVAEVQDVSPQVLENLQEIQVPSLHNLTQTEVDSYFVAAARRPLQDHWNGFPNGEPFRDFHARVTSAVDSTLAVHGIRSLISEEFVVWTAPARGHTLRIAIVAHGGTNAVILTHLLGLPPVPWEWIRFETPLAAVTTVALRGISVDSYAWSLQRFGWRNEPDALDTPR